MCKCNVYYHWLYISWGMYYVAITRSVRYACCRLRGQVCLHVAARCTAWQGWLTRPSRRALSPSHCWKITVHCWAATSIFTVTHSLPLAWHYWPRRRACSVSGGESSKPLLYQHYLLTIPSVRVQWIYLRLHSSSNNLSEDQFIEFSLTVILTEAIRCHIISYSPKHNAKIPNPIF